MCRSTTSRPPGAPGRRPRMGIATRSRSKARRRRRSNRCGRRGDRSRRSSSHEGARRSFADRVAALPRAAREPVEGVPVRPLVSRGAGIAYSALLRLAAPIYLARLWWRGRAEPLYRAAIGERFGRYDDAASTGWLWIHAVSLGETRAAGALIDALRVRRPQLRL